MIINMFMIIYACMQIWAHAVLADILHTNLEMEGNYSRMDYFEMKSN